MGGGQLGYLLTMPQSLPAGSQEQYCLTLHGVAQDTTITLNLVGLDTGDVHEYTHTYVNGKGHVTEYTHTCVSGKGHVTEYTHTCVSGKGHVTEYTHTCVSGKGHVTEYTHTSVNGKGHVPEYTHTYGNGRMMYTSTPTPMSMVQ